MFFKSEAHITGWEALFASVLFSLLDSRSRPDTDAGSWSCRCPLGSEVTPLMCWHLPACQDVCREREGATAGAVRLPVASLCWRSYLQWLAWPCCTALFTILSYLSICYFYFKFKEGLVFAKPYLLFLTRLDGLIAKKSASSSQPCTSYVTIQSSSRFSCICPLQSLIALAAGVYLPKYKAGWFKNKWDLQNYIYQSSLF